MRRITTALIAALTAISLPAIAADPTDIVTFVNGDRLTGEFKSLERGKLRFKTAATDTILIEWDNVAFLKSDQNIQVETENGARYLGHLSAATDEKRLVLEMSSGPVVLENEHVILMTPIEGVRRDRIDGDVSAGYTFAKAKDVKTTNLSFDLNYRTEARIWALDYDTLVTDSSEDDEEDDDEGASEDLSLALEYQRLLRNRWLAGGIVRFERNDELGLDLRTSIGAAGGRILRQSDNSSFSLTGGLFVSREDTVVSDPDISLQSEEHVIEDYLEASVKLTWDWFRYDTPELDLMTTLQIYPNLTDTGQYRGEFEIELKWEIIEDMFWSLSLTETYDSKVDEITGEGKKRDYSIITSVGWDF
jgi:Protein of unknown function, DUF481